MSQPGAEPVWTHFRLEPLAAGVWVAVALPGSGAIANAGIVDLGDRSLVFDTFLTPQAAEELRAACVACTGQPPTYVVNSHRHGDHVQGNQVFPEAEIIATSRTRETMAVAGPQALEQARARVPAMLHEAERTLARETDPAHRAATEARMRSLQVLQAALPALELRLPTVTFEQHVVLHGPRQRAELYCYGGGHTESDAIMYLPAARIAFLGDLAAVENHAGLGDGDPEESIRILEQIAVLDIGTVVPGHGPPGTMADLDRLRGYITALVRLASEQLAAGRPVEALADLAIPPPYDRWAGDDVFVRNMQFLYERLAPA